MNDEDRSLRRYLRNPEMIAALSAVVIGACALVVAFVEVRIMRADQRSSVLPLVELSRSYYRTRDDEGDGTLTHLKFNAENVGIGPARIADFRVTVDARPYPTWGAAIQALLGSAQPIGYGQSTIMGRTIPAGRSIDMFQLNDADAAGDIYASFDRLNFTACFCSVYAECWVTSYRDFGSAEQVEECRPDASSFQE